MPEPRDEQENLFIDSLGSEMLMLGINDEAVEGTWVFDSDGSPVDWSKPWIQWRDYPGIPLVKNDLFYSSTLRLAWICVQDVDVQ